MTRFIAVVSGKGGAGKTTTTINIGQALLSAGRKVMLVDGNVITPNLGVHLGVIDPKSSVNQFLRKQKTLKEIMYMHESGLPFIPASPSYAEFQKTNPQKLHELLEQLDNAADFVLIDAPSGLGIEVSHVLKHADEALVVVTPTLTSAMDALKTIQLAKSQNCIIAGVVLNMTHRGRNELTAEEVEHIVGHTIIASIRDDRKIRKSLYNHAPATYLYPHSRVAKQFRKVAQFLTFEALP